MKLVLYSGYDEDNRQIDEQLVQLIDKPSPKVTFIPSAHHLPDHDYEYFCQSFEDFGIRDIRIFNVDQPFSSAQAEAVLRSDMIYLSGGNTYYFLHWIRRQGFEKKLKEFVQNGGVLAGLSAGAILMTPSIATASYPKFDKDHNEVKIKDLTALNLVKFEFFPHYTPVEEYAKELKKQSKKINWPIYGVDDGGGIIVDGNTIKFFGKVWGYLAGKEYLVNPF